jgi:hypothetical protein
LIRKSYILRVRGTEVYKSISILMFTFKSLSYLSLLYEL